MVRPSVKGVLVGLSFLLLATPTHAQTAAVFGTCTAVERMSFEATEDGRQIFRSVAAECGENGRLYADEVILTSGSSVFEARGNVTLHQPDLNIFAHRAVFDRKTGYGTFYDAAGSARVGAERMERSMFGTLEPDVEFWGQTIERVGPRRYRITRGGMTTCAQPTRRWEFGASGATVALDEYAILKNAVLKVKGVPLFYIPVIYYPLSEDDRSTGFLLPSYSTSSLRGTGLSNAFFWATARNHDATFFHDYFSKSGQGYGGEFRYIASPGSRGDARYYILDEKEQTDGTTVIRPAARSHNFRASANQELPRGFRLLGQADYFSNVTTQRLYEQDIYQLSQHERYFTGTLSGVFARHYRLSAVSDLRDRYTGLSSTRRQGRLPTVNLSMNDRPLGRSRMYFGVGGEAAYLVYQEDTSKPDTNRSLPRFDMSPRLRAALSGLPWLVITPVASWRLTHWRESEDPVTNVQVPVPLTRSLFDLQANIGGPSFSRVFQRAGGKYADAFKHLIEPSVNIRWTSTFDRFDDVVRLDHVDSIVGGTTQIAYSLTNRLLARRPSPGGAAGGTGMAREILTVDIRQTYYSNARASSFDRDYDSSVTQPNPYSPVQINVNARPTDATNGQVSLEFDSDHRALRSMSASTFVGSRQLLMRAGWHKRFVIEGLQGFDDPRFATHYLYADTSLRTRDNHFGGTYAFNLDLLNHRLVQQRVIAYYNAQCCGVSFDYQTRGLPTSFGGTQTERTFGISFTLAGIGSFSNPFGSFGGGDRR